MKRRQFLKGAAVAGTGAALASNFPTPAIAQGKVEWKMVTTWPKNFPGLGTGAERLAKRVSDLTDGRLTVKVFAAGELVPPFESFDAVSRGTADMGHAAAYYWQGKSKATNFFAAVPFGLTATEHSAWIHHGGGQKLWDELYAQFNLKPFIAGNTGVQMGGWFRKELKSVEDFKGLKYRMPGLGGEVLKKLGAVALNLPGGEIFPALQAGTIDGTEWVGPWNDMAFGFYKVAKFYYWPGFHEPGTALEVFCNKQKYDALPKDMQAAIAIACQADENEMLAEFNARNGESLQVLVRQHGVQLRQTPRDMLTAIGNASGELIKEILDGGDPMTKKVAQSFLKSRRELLNWNRIADQAYLNARTLQFKYG